MLQSDIKTFGQIYHSNGTVRMFYQKLREYQQTSQPALGTKYVSTNVIEKDICSTISYQINGNHLSMFV